MTASRVARLLLIWTIVCIVLVVLAFVFSEGEPVCEGPLILGADDSDPPQCADPIEGLAPTAPLILVAGLLVTGVIAGLGAGFDRLRAGAADRAEAKGPGS
jgi:hypothetical protein